MGVEDRLAQLEAQVAELEADNLAGTSADMWWLVSNGLVPAGLAWASMYIIMAIMEELSDNPKATVEKAARSPTKKPPSTTKGRSKSPAKLNSPRRTKLKGFKDT